MAGASRTRKLRTVNTLLYGVFLVNFVSFLAGATYLGGDAINGKAEGGRYYLFGMRTEYGHKVYTEVSKGVFIYSKWHVYFLVATFLLALAAAAVGHLAKKQSDEN